MSVTFSVLRTDPRNGRLIWPVTATTEPEDFQVNFGNANAADLLAALGLSWDGGTGEMPIPLFSGLITQALRRGLCHRSPERPPIIDAKSDRLTIIHLGAPEGHIKRRLAALVQRGRAAGATHIGWG
ncbi:conserved protein of unknown function (plasmid) [Rhodovastum atsumiense]|uniref:hypothetical protein n=1 Tax=Rhodovastum atsumiense TaxID=504468 RepID=UPI0020252D99|nr:hypothetical protein [Rhodovastum atsumiense]CAH2605945.1 conserved protein of unknown function [Rhodovastum atsumiense]